MWTVVYIAPNLARAELLKEKLISEGLMVALRPVGLPHNGNGGAVEILVTELEAEEAHEILSAAATT
jgi:hypothetical protein